MKDDHDFAMAIQNIAIQQVKNLTPAKKGESVNLGHQHLTKDFVNSKTGKNCLKNIEAALHTVNINTIATFEKVNETQYQISIKIQ